MRELHSASPIDFSVAVADHGYRWWYVDALSDDGRVGLVIIAFIGSVFSPYYAWSRERGQGGAANHCAINVALYRPESGRWCMTERNAQALARGAHWLRIGPSSLAWDGETLTIEINERCAPIPRSLRGRVTLRPQHVLEKQYVLAENGLHLWHPIAPRARVEVDFSDPGWRWSGHGYWDSNTGQAPMEDAFRTWNWSRARLMDGRLAVLYDIERRDSSQERLALEFGPGAGVSPFVAPGPVLLPSGMWGVARATRSDHGNARVVRMLEDGPFYTRSAITTQLLGQPVVAMHESLDLDRIRKQWVRMLLPFRMPRIT